jgi:hypothetical protein
MKALSAKNEMKSIVHDTIEIESIVYTIVYRI